MPRRRRALAYAGRALSSVIALAVMAPLLLFSLVLAALTCDDNCDTAEQASSWGYQAQLYLAAAGAITGVVALVLGFTSKSRPYGMFAAASVVCWVIWILWVPGNF